MVKRVVIGVSSGQNLLNLVYAVHGIKSRKKNKKQGRKIQKSQHQPTEHKQPLAYYGIGKPLLAGSATHSPINNPKDLTKQQIPACKHNT